MKVIVPTRHIEKLKRLGCYDAWLSNLKNNTIGKKDDISWSGDDWNEFINSSFIWRETPEGSEYWREIYDTP